MRPLAVLAALVALLVPAAAHATYPGQNAELAFQSSRDGDNEIFLLNGDGSGVTQLTHNGAADLNPVWSPDGQRIAFQSNRDGDSEIWVMNADGSGQAQLTNDPAFDASPTWSPDGTRIAFASRRDGDDEIFAMNADGTGVVQLTANVVTDEDPTWGTLVVCTSICETVERIGFASDRDGNEEIYSMAADGTDQVNLTNHPATDREPNWRSSPGGGERIAFASDRAPEDSGFDVWSVPGYGNPIGQRITNSAADEVSPAYSPAGDRIAYEVSDADREVYAASSIGEDPVNVTNAPTNERSPDWRSMSSFGTFPRPKGATPIRASLVLAYPQCTAPDRTHGPPLAFESCGFPTPASPNVNVGNPRPDGTGAAANMAGSVRFDVLVGAPGPPEDSDVAIGASITDVRCDLRDINIHPFPCGAPNSLQQNDYVGELQGSVDATVTDRWNNQAVPGGRVTDGATTAPFPWEFPIPCQATASTSTGGVCSTSTSFNALVPGAVRDGRRTVWGLGQMKVYDAGPDGVVGNGDGRALFAAQGLFVP